MDEPPALAWDATLHVVRRRCGTAAARAVRVRDRCLHGRIHRLRAGARGPRRNCSRGASTGGSRGRHTARRAESTGTAGQKTVRPSAAGSDARRRSRLRSTRLEAGSAKVTQSRCDAGSRKSGRRPLCTRAGSFDLLHVRCAWHQLGAWIPARAAHPDVARAVHCFDRLQPNRCGARSVVAAGCLREGDKGERELSQVREIIQRARSGRRRRRKGTTFAPASHRTCTASSAEACGGAEPGSGRGRWG